MSPVSHLMISWLASNTLDVGVRERTLITLAGLSADIDGLGLVVDVLTRGSASPTNYWGELHHSLHTLLVSAIVSVVVFVCATKHKVTTAVLAFGMFQVHLFCDLIGARGPDGYQWPIPYFMPFSASPRLVWSGQWELNAWQNIVIAILLVFMVCFVAIKKQRTPFEITTNKLDLVCLGLIKKSVKGLTRRQG